MLDVKCADKAHDADGDGITLTAMLKTLDAADKGKYPEMREALAEFCPTQNGHLPTSAKLGYKLRRFARRNVGGKCFDATRGRGGIMRWFVRSLRPADEFVVGGDDGDGGHSYVASFTHASEDALVVEGVEAAAIEVEVVQAALHEFHSRRPRQDPR